MALTILVLFSCRCLAAVGYDPVYGARPVKRAIQRELETPLAQALLRGQFEVRSSTHFQGHQPAVLPCCGGTAAVGSCRGVAPYVRNRRFQGGFGARALFCRQKLSWHPVL